VLPEVWAEASTLDRFVVRHIAPLSIDQMFRFMVHPGVYGEIGLPAWRTWMAVNSTPERVALRYQATRPVLNAVVDAGILREGRIPEAWQRLCGVDRRGAPRESTRGKRVAVTPGSHSPTKWRQPFSWIEAWVAGVSKWRS
jgi:hypothetical protein